MSNPLLPLLLAALVIGVMAYPPFTGTDTLLTDIEESASNLFGAGEWPATVKDVFRNHSQDRNASGNGTIGSGSSLGGIVDLLDGEEDAADTPAPSRDAAPPAATGPDDDRERNNTPPGNDTTVTPSANDMDTAAPPANDTNTTAPSNNTEPRVPDAGPGNATRNDTNTAGGNTTGTPAGGQTNGTEPPGAGNNATMSAPSKGTEGPAADENETMNAPSNSTSNATPANRSTEPAQENGTVHSAGNATADDGSGARCEADIARAKQADDDRVCTQQFAVMQCPYGDVTYGAANGCQISYLEGIGWTRESAGTNETPRREWRGTGNAGSNSTDIQNATTIPANASHRNETRSGRNQSRGNTTDSANATGTSITPANDTVEPPAQGNGTMRPANSSGGTEAGDTVGRDAGGDNDTATDTRGSENSTTAAAGNATAPVAESDG